MLEMFIMLWILAVVIICTNPFHESFRWAGMFAFLSGFGGVAVFLRESVIPLLSSQNTNLIFFLRYLSGISDTLFKYIAPYVLILFALNYSGIVSQHTILRRILKTILFTPVVLMYLIYPITPEFNPSYVVLSLWAAPYFLAADALLVYSYLKEKRTLQKRQRLITCIVVIPTVTYTLITSFILVALDIHDVWRYNVWIVALLFVMFTIFAIRHGVLGVRLKIERQRLENTMKLVTSGTAIMNHALKNEAAKILLCTENINNQAPESDQDRNEKLKIIKKSAEHLLEIATKVQEHTEDIALKKELRNIGVLIDEALFLVKPYIDDNEINVIKTYDNGVSLLCDAIHIRETFANIFRNAVEAMPKGGVIEIDVTQNRKQVIVSIKDNGPGISKENLAHVTEPFFSTRKHNKNFGLGLFYCYKVMKAHGGEIEIHSREKVGTNVALIFPSGTAALRKSAVKEAVRCTGLEL
jgi:signal transduction histidine kinase